MCYVTKVTSHIPSQKGTLEGTTIASTCWLLTAAIVVLI